MSHQESPKARVLSCLQTHSFWLLCVFVLGLLACTSQEAVAQDPKGQQKGQQTKAQEEKDAEGHWVFVNDDETPTSQPGDSEDEDEDNLDDEDEDDLDDDLVYPWPRDQFALAELFRWNDMIVARTGYYANTGFWVVDPAKDVAKKLKIEGTHSPLGLATYKKHESLALCRNAEGLSLFSVSGNDARPMKLPPELVHAKGDPLLVADESSIVVCLDGLLFRYCRETGWKQTKVEMSALKRSSVSGIGLRKAWPPRYCALAGESLFVGYNRGEWGGGLGVIDTLTGATAGVKRPEEKRLVIGHVTSIVGGPTGHLWMMQGCHHMGPSGGCLRRLDSKEWTTIAKLGKGWELPESSFDSVAFDKEGRLYLLGYEFGVARQEGKKWVELTKPWPELASPVSLLILPGDKAVIALYDAGILIWDFKTQDVKRITLEEEKKPGSVEATIPKPQSADPKTAITAPVPEQRDTVADRETPYHPWLRNQVPIAKLCIWNDQIIARLRLGAYKPFWVIDPTKDVAEPLAIGESLGPLSLATYKGKESLAICRDSEGLCLFSVSGDNAQRMELPPELVHAEGIPILLADESSIVVCVNDTIHYYKQGTWHRSTRQAEGKEYFAFMIMGGKRPWPPDYVALLGDTLFIGYDRGEFGGGLGSVRVSSGELACVNADWRADGGWILHATDIVIGPAGCVWVTEGNHHRRVGGGRLHRFDGKEWAIIADIGEGWSLPDSSFDSVAFDTEGRLYVLGWRFGVARREGEKWVHLTRRWPADACASSLLITPEGKGIIAACDAGVLVWDFETEEVKRITLSRRRKPASKPAPPLTSQPTSAPADD